MSPSESGRRPAITPRVALRHAALVSRPKRSPWLCPYQRTRSMFAQLKVGFGIPRAGFRLSTGYRSRELAGGVHQTVDWCTQLQVCEWRVTC
jgi:hypothetical protein